MADWTPKRETIRRRLSTPVLISEFENLGEQRRAVSEKVKKIYSITTPNLTREGARGYKNHFLSKFGALTSFTMPDPFESGTPDVRVRFVPDSFEENFSGGVVKVSFELVSVNN